MENLLRWIGMFIPIATFAALAVSTYLFVKNKGTVDALRESANTYKGLAESKKAALEDKEQQLDKCIETNKELEKQLLAKDIAMDKAVDELIQGFERARNSG